MATADAAKSLFDGLLASSDASQFQRDLIALSRLLKVEETCVLVVTSPWVPHLVHFLVHAIMNSQARPRSAKLEALNCLLSLSTVPDEDFRERLLFAQVVRLDSAFENLLDENEQWQKENGFGIGRQHEQVVVLLMRCTGYKLTAADLLHSFCNDRLDFAMFLLISIFSRQFYEIEVQEATLRCLFELSLPQTYFGSDGDAGGSPGTEIQLAAFEKHVDVMIETSMRLGVTNTLAKNFTFLTLRASEPHFQLRWSRIMRRFSTMFLNLLRFTTNVKLATSWRQMVLVSDQELFTVVILPHLATSASWLGQRLRSPQPLPLAEANEIVNSFSACLRFLCVAAFNLPASLYSVLRRLRKLLVDLSHPVLDFPPQFQRAQLPLYAHLLQCHVNLDSMIAPGGVAAQDTSDAPTGVSEHDRLLLLHELRTLFAILGSSRATTAAQSESSLQRLFKLVRLDSEARFVSFENATYAMLESVAAQLPAVATADAAITAAEVTVHRSVSDPFLGANLDDDELDRMAAQLDEQIEELERAVDEVQHTRELLDGISPRRAQPQQQLRESQNGASGGGIEGLLLGALPPLSSTSPHRANQNVAATRSAAAPPSKKRFAIAKDCPKEFLCGFSKKMMQHPVRLPNGNVYEQSVLEKVIDAVGHVDPVTGEALDFELDIDLALQRRIVEYSIKQSINCDGEVLF